MSNYDDYEDKIFRIKGEFVNFLKKYLEKNSDDMVNQKEIKKIVYEFVFDQIADKGIKVIEGKNKKKVLFFNFFCNVVDFCFSFSGVIIDVISDLKRYGDLEKYEIKEKIIDA